MKYRTKAPTPHSHGSDSKMFMLWRWLRGRYTRHMEDRAKIEAKLKQLNGGSLEGDWDEASDFTMMPAIKYDKTAQQYTITMDSGISVKVFINTKTGETQMFWAEWFMKK